MAKRKEDNGNGRRLATQQSVDQAVKSICDIMRRGNCAGAMRCRCFTYFRRGVEGRADKILIWPVEDTNRLEDNL